MQFTRNPENIFELNVFRGDCGTDAAALTDYVSDECPESSVAYFVRVRRREFAPDTCDEYGIEVSNGVYSE